MLVDALRPFREASGYSLLTAVGLVLGFARELTVASTFGLSPQLDVFVALIALQLLFGAQIGNALETVFISRVAKEGGAVAVSRASKPALCGLVLVNFGVVLFLLGSGGFLVHNIFPYASMPQQQALGIRMLRSVVGADRVREHPQACSWEPSQCWGLWLLDCWQDRSISLSSIVSVICASPSSWVSWRFDPGCGSGKYVW